MYKISICIDDLVAIELRRIAMDVWGESKEPIRMSTGWTGMQFVNTELDSVCGIGSSREMIAR